jgi:hypothetical protein
MIVRLRLHIARRRTSQFSAVHRMARARASPSDHDAWPDESPPPDSVFRFYLTSLRAIYCTPFVPRQHLMNTYDLLRPFTTSNELSLDIFYSMIAFPRHHCFLHPYFTLCILSRPELKWVTIGFTDNQTLFRAISFTATRRPTTVYPNHP